MKTTLPPLKSPPSLSRLHELKHRLQDVREGLDSVRERFERIQHRHENGTAPRAVVAHQLFQTPPDLAEKLVSRLISHAGSLEGKAVLEPSAGLGRILDALAPHKPGELVAVDQSPQCIDILHKRTDLMAVHCADFLSLTLKELCLFDAIAMNPPFTMRSDIKHILHAKKMLFPGGVLVALCMDTPQREQALKPLCESWEPIPAGTFRREGTEVPTVLLTMTN